MQQNYISFIFVVCMLVAQLCPTLCNPMECNSPGYSVHGILQARLLEWVAIAFSRGSSQPKDQTGSLALQADYLPSEPPGKPNFVEYLPNPILINLPHMF